MKEDQLNITFIGGTGRSGTNITKKILSKHSQVASLPFEYRFSIDPFCIIDTYLSLKNNWSPYNAHAKVKQMENILNRMGSRSIKYYLSGKILNKIDPDGKLITPPAYYEWEMDKWFPNYCDHLKNLINDITEFEYNSYWPGEDPFIYKNRMRFIPYDMDLRIPFRKFFTSIFNDFLKKNDCTHFVEDNTWNLLYAQQLQELLPEAKFIHLYRDPRDVVASLLTQRWAPNSVNQAVKYYRSLISRIIESQEFINSKNYLEIKFEELTTDKEKVIEIICEFVKLEMEQLMYEVNLSDNNSGRFKNDFTQEEQKYITKALKPFLKKYNYLS